MNPIQKLNGFKMKLTKIVERYKNESNRYKRQALRLKIVSVFLASLITIFLGLKLNNSEIASSLSNVALVLGAAITLLSAYEAF